LGVEVEAGACGRKHLQTLQPFANPNSMRSPLYEFNDLIAYQLGANPNPMHRARRYRSTCDMIIGYCRSAERLLKYSSPPIVVVTANYSAARLLKNRRYSL
jgi:hypothetical protein